MRAIPVNFPSPFCSHPPLLFTAYSVQPNCSSWFIERFSCLDTCGYALYTYEKLMVGIVQIRRKQRALVKIKKAPDFFRNQELFGGDCWTRTSDLLRVKRSGRLNSPQNARFYKGFVRCSPNKVRIIPESLSYFVV